MNAAQCHEQSKKAKASVSAVGCGWIDVEACLPLPAFLKRMSWGFSSASRYTLLPALLACWGPLFYHCNLVPWLKMIQDGMTICPPCRFQASVVQVQLASTSSHSSETFSGDIYRSGNSKSVPGYTNEHVLIWIEVQRKKNLVCILDASTWILALCVSLLLLSALHYYPSRRTIPDGHRGEQLWFQAESFIPLLVPDPQQVLP